MLFEMIMASIYKTKETMSHCNRTPKEEHLTWCRESFSQNRSNVTILRSLKKYACSFFSVKYTSLAYVSLRDRNLLIFKPNAKDNFTNETFLLGRPNSVFKEIRK